MVELLVALLIISILLAITIPTFLGTRHSAQNRSAESDLHNALVTAKTYYSGRGTYAGLTLATLRSSEPSYDWITGTITTGSPDATISVASGDQHIYLATLSASGQCYFVADVESATSSAINPSDGITGPGTWFANFTTTDTSGCSAGSLPSGFSPSFTNSGASGPVLKASLGTYNSYVSPTVVDYPTGVTSTSQGNGNYTGVLFPNGAATNNVSALAYQSYTAPSGHTLSSISWAGGVYNGAESQLTPAVWAVVNGTQELIWSDPSITSSPANLPPETITLPAGTTEVEIGAESTQGYNDANSPEDTLYEQPTATLTNGPTVMMY